MPLFYNHRAQFDITPESLAGNDAFFTAMVHASQIAMRTHQREKLEALRNAVLNTALLGAPDDDLQLMFLDAIDVLTPSHLRLLSFLSNPSHWAMSHDNHPSQTASMAEISLADRLVRAMPELTNQRENLQLLHDNLLARGFLVASTFTFDTTWPPEVNMSKLTSLLGDQFLAFIKSPVEGLDETKGE